MSKFSFSYDHNDENFHIAALDGSRTLTLPYDKKLSRMTHWPIWPKPLFVRGEDGTEISVNGDLHSGKGVLFHNLEEDWFVRMGRRPAYAWLKRPHDMIFDRRVCPQSNTRVDLQRVTIELFDFRNDVQAFFAATLIDDDGVTGNYARLDKEEVEGRKLEGAWFGNGGCYSFQNPASIKEGLEKFHADFVANYEACARMCETGIGIDYSTNKRLYKGDPAKGEPLLTIHVMNEETQGETYAKPDEVLEFFGREVAADGKSLALQPLAERDGTAIYKVRGGYLVEVGPNYAFYEDYYLIDGLPWLFHAKRSLANTPASEIGPDLHIIDLDHGMTLMSYGGYGGIGPSGWKRKALKRCMAALPDPAAAAGIITLVNEGMMPNQKEELKEARYSSRSIYIVPFKPTLRELRYIFDPQHYASNDPFAL